MAEFKDRLKEAMQIKNMSAAELSRAASVNEGAISQYLKGSYKANQRTLEKLARALNVSIPWLMGDDSSPMEAIYISRVFGQDPNRFKLNQDVINRAIQKAFAEIEIANATPPDQRTAEIIKAVNKLNNEGKVRVLQYIHDLSDKYRK